MRPGGRRLPQLLLAALAPVVLALAVAAAAPAAPEGGQPPPDAAWPTPAAYAQQATPPPRAVNVTSDAQSRVYHLGERIEIDVGFDKPVVIDPAAPPSLVVGLDGGVSRTAFYASGNNTAALAFAYTVQYGDVSSDLDYGGTDSLRGSLSGAGGGAADTTLPRPGGPDSLAGSGDILVDYAAPRLFAADTVRTGDPRLGSFSGGERVDAFSMGNRTYAAVAVEEGLLLVRVDERGSMSLAGSAFDSADASYKLADSRGVAVTALGAGRHALVASYGEDAVQLVRIHDDGTLEVGKSLGDHGDLKLDRLRNVAVLDVNGSAHALATSYGEDAVQLVRMHDDGTLEAGESLGDSGGLKLYGSYDVAVLDVNGGAHALVTGYAEHGIQLVRVHDNGTLEARESWSLGAASFNWPQGVAALDVNGGAHALVSSGGTDTVQLVRVHDNGTLAVVASAVNGDRGFDGLDNPYYISVFTGASGGTYAAVTAVTDHAVQLIRVREDGALFAAGSADRHRAGFGELRTPRGIDVFTLGGGTYALASSGATNGGLQLMRLSPASAARVDSAASDGVYLAGSTIEIAVRFDAPVRVDGPLEMRLNSGGKAVYDRGNNSDALVFRYTVQRGEYAADLDYAGADALSGSGAITDDSAGLPANRTLPLPGTGRSLGDLENIAADGGATPIISVATAAANGTYTTPGAEIDIAVTFNASVRVDGPLGMRLNSGGVAVYHSGSGSSTLVFRYTVQHGEYAADLDYAGAGALSGSGAITDASTGRPAGRALPVPGTGGSLGDLKDIKVDTVPPSVASAAAPEDGVYGAGRVVNVTVGFDEPVRYSGGPPSLALDVGGEAREAAYASGSGTSELVFSYTVRAGDYEDDLGYLGAGALSGRIADLAANPANLTLPAPGSPGSLRASHDVLIDHAAPRLIAAAWASDGGGGANATGTFAALGAAADADTIVANGGTYAVVASAEGAVQLIRVHGNGTMEMEDEARHNATAGTLLSYAYGVDAFYMGGDAYAIAAAHSGSAVQLLRVHGGSGTLSPVDSLGDTGGSGNTGLELAGATRARVFEMNDALYALAAGFNDDGIQLVRVHGNGTLEARESWSLRDDGGGSLELDNAFDAAVFDLAGAKHALVTGYADDGIQLVRIRESGALEPVDSMDDSEGDLELAGARGVAVFDLGEGKKHALVSSQGDSGIQLVRIRGDGTMEPAGSASNGDPGFDRLGGAFGISVLGGSPGGVYAAVTSRADPGGVQLVRVRGGDGALLPAGSVADGDDAGGFAELAGAHGIAAFGKGGRSYALVAAIGDNGVQLVRTSTASVASVTTDAAGGPHGPGSAIDIAVAFDAPVLAEGPLELRLNTGGAARYISGSGGSTLLFRYEVAAGDRDAAVLGYDGAHALRAGPGGSIAENATGLHANALLPPPGSPGSLGGSARVAVDTPPAVVSVSSPDLPGTYGIGETIRIRVHFGEAVTVTGRPLLGLDTGGTDRDARYASGSGGRTLLFTYTVGAGDESSTGLDYASASALSLGPGGAIADMTGNAAYLSLPEPGSAGSLAGTPGLVVDGVRPLAVSASSPNATGPLGAGETIHIVVGFSEPVTVRGAPLLALDTGQAGRSAEYASGSGTTSLLFLYTVAAGDDSPDLDYAGASALSLGPGGAIADAAGNAADLSLPEPGSPGSLAGTSDVLVRGGPASRTATADAVFAGSNTVRIAYSAPLGAPAAGAGPVYGAITLAGGGGGGGGGDAAVRHADSVTGLGTAVHTVRFAGGGAALDQTGTIALEADLARTAENGTRYEFTEDVIAVRAGASVRTVTPAGQVPVVAIERDSFVRVVDVTGGGYSVRLAINVSGLAASTPPTPPPPAQGAGGMTVTFPGAGGGISVIASFASVSFPPGVTAVSVPPDGLLVLHVSGSAPTPGQVAAALGVDASYVSVQRVVEVGDDAMRVVFDMPVRILLEGQAGGRAFYVDNTSGEVVPIRTACAADDTAAVHAQLGGAPGGCWFDRDGDKVVYTYHLTRFGTAAAPTALEVMVAGAAAGGTVRVPAGTYAEDVLVINKSLTIEPADPGDPPVLTGYSRIAVASPPQAGAGAGGGGGGGGGGPVVIRGLVFKDTTRAPGGGGAGGLASIVVEPPAPGAPGAAAAAMPVTIEGNTFRNTCDAAVRAAAGAPPAAGAQPQPIAGLTVRDNMFYDIGGNRANCGAGGGEPADAAADLADAIVAGRYVAAGAPAAAGPAQLAGMAVQDNYIFGTTYTGIRIAGAYGLAVTGNHIEGVPDDGVRIIGSRNVQVHLNTIVGANSAPRPAAAAAAEAPHDGAAGAAIEVWSGSDNVAATLNRVSGSAGAFLVCAGACDPGPDAASGTGGGPVPVAAVPVNSAGGAGDMRFSHNVLAESNTGVLVDNAAGGELDARANYYPGYAASAAGRVSPAGAVLHEPALNGAGPVRIGAVVADGPPSAIRSVDAAVRAAFELGVRDFNAEQARAGGAVGLEPAVHAVDSPDYTAAARAGHASAVSALLDGSSADARMLPVLHNSISSAMSLYDASGAAGLAAISAMGASYAHYPFVLDRGSGAIVAHGANASLVGGRAGGDGAGLPDFSPSASAAGDAAAEGGTGVEPGHPDAPWKWRAHESVNPATGASEPKRSALALHPGPDGAAHTEDDLVFGAGYHPGPGAAHLVVAAGDAAAAAAAAAAGSGAVVAVSPASTASQLAARDALFRLAPPDGRLAGVVVAQALADRQGAAAAAQPITIVALNDSASLQSMSLAGELHEIDLQGVLPDGADRVAVVSYNSSSPPPPSGGAAGSAGAGGGGWASAAADLIRAAASESRGDAAVVYSGRAGAFAALADALGGQPPPNSRWYSTGELARAELAASGPDAAALARAGQLAAVLQRAVPNATTDAALAAPGAGIVLDESTRGPAYAAYDAPALLGRAMASTPGIPGAPAAVARAIDEDVARTHAGALGSPLILDRNGDLVLPIAYVVSAFPAAAAGADPGGAWGQLDTRIGERSCGIALAKGALDFGILSLGRYSRPDTQTVINTGTLPYRSVTLDPGDWTYASGQTLPASITELRELGRAAAYAGAASGFVVAPGLEPGQDRNVQFRINLTAYQSLPPGEASQTINYLVECRAAAG